MKYLLYSIYWSIAIIIGIAYAIRGINWYRIEKGESVKKGEIIHQGIFHFSATLSGFIALAISYKIFNSFEVKSLSNISAGSAGLLIFLYIWGTVGVSGWLTNVIVNINDIFKGLIKK